MRLKSLETNWLRNIDRTIPIPEFMWHPLVGAAGKYYHPIPYEMYDMDGHPIEMHKGVIVLNPKYERDAASNIAHEWRHHWQYWNGHKFQPPKKGKFKKDYVEDLIQYFTTSWTEMDALRFEYKMAGIHELWEDVLFDYLKDLKPKRVWL